MIWFQNKDGCFHGRILFHNSSFASSPWRPARRVKIVSHCTLVPSTGGSYQLILSPCTRHLNIYNLKLLTAHKEKLVVWIPLSIKYGVMSQRNNNHSRGADKKIHKKTYYRKGIIVWTRLRRKNLYLVNRIWQKQFSMTVTDRAKR